MSIIRIKNYIILSVILFSFTNVAHASLEITEVNYNPEVKTNHLWIKILNNDSNDVTLTDWFVADYDGTSWHYHAINADSSSILTPNSSAVIAKASSTTIDDFKNKNSNITDLLFYGNLTIDDKGILGLSKDKKIVIANKSYGGAITPPDTNTNSSINEISSTSTSGNTSNSSSPKEEIKVYNIATKIISPKVVTAGVPFIIDHVTTGKSKEKVIFGKFVWNFGDGMIKSSQTSDSFRYTYQYPGDYVLTLSYSESSFNIKPDATDRLVIKVIPSGIVISSVGTSIDPFVEIENNSSYEMSLRDFIVKGSVHSFLIPEDMIILPNKKLKLSPKITGFDLNDLNSITIVDSSGQIFATYPNKIIPIIKDSVNKILKGNIIKLENIKNNQIENIPEVINLNDLGASTAVLSTKVSNNTFAWLGLVVIIFIAFLGIFFVRRKNIDDYEEKEIRASDMTIIE